VKGEIIKILPLPVTKSGDESYYRVQFPLEIAPERAGRQRALALAEI